MTREALANAIRSRFKTEVADAQSLATIYDNDPSDPPTDNSLWCRLTVLDGETRRITVGVKQYRMVGVAIVQLFGPVGDGTQALSILADAIVTAFRDVTAAGVRYGVPSVQNLGRLEEGHYQMNVTCPFTADTVEA